MSITFSTCYYIIKSKFDNSIYIEWMNNFLSIVNEFNLVIYTDENTLQYIHTNNPRIRVIIKPIEAFHNYKYKEDWIKNHEKNYLLNNKISWEVNMLWSEKVWFVNDTYKNQYFDTDMYGWCDIGYFRGRLNDTSINKLKQWASPEAILQLSKDKIHYSIINNDSTYMNELFKIVNNKNELGLPAYKIPENQNSVAGGFFILHKGLIDGWCRTYDMKLELYFKNDYLVKDDQIILIDCILSELSRFQIHKEHFCEDGIVYDNWFMFQRILQ